MDANKVFDGSAIDSIFKLLSTQTPDREKISMILNKKINAQSSEKNFPKYSQWEPSMIKRLHQIAGGTMDILGYK